MGPASHKQTYGKGCCREVGGSPLVLLGNLALRCAGKGLGRPGELRANFASGLPDSLGTLEGGGGEGKEVNPLGNLLSQAVGRRRHHRGSQAGQGQGFPTGVTGLCGAIHSRLGPVSPGWFLSSL